ncbi:MAG: flagellar assembly protein FliH [Rhodocyclaceae bacterium]|nr:flagellar assembly protein FliH [Rhodocyclaceae bacterium]
MIGTDGLTAWERWEMGSFDGAPKPAASSAAPADAPAPEPAARLPTAAEVAEIEGRAREEGHQAGLVQGLAEGRAEGEAQVRAEAARLAAAAEKLEAALAGIEQEVGEEVMGLALAIARQVVRHELATRPEALVDVVREALVQLPHQHVAIHLNPGDASLVRAHVGDQLAHAGHRIFEDPRLPAGDCLVEAGGSQVDAGLEARWRRVVETLGIQSAWQDAEEP